MHGERMHERVTRWSRRLVGYATLVPLAAVWLACGLGGGETSEPAAQEPPPPPPPGQITQSGQSQNQCEDESCVVRVYATGFEVRGVVAGAEARFGDVSATAGPTAENPNIVLARVEHDFAPFVSSFEVNRLFGSADSSYRVSTQEELTVEHPDGRSFTGPLAFPSAQMRRMLGWLLRRALDGQPVSFAPEGEGTALYFVERPRQRNTRTPAPRLVGEAATPGDIRYVAQMTSEARELSGCGTYRSRSTGGTRTIERRTVDATVVVHDRRTGQEAHRREFRGPTPRCTRTVRGTQTSMFDREALDAWVESLATPGG